MKYQGYIFNIKINKEKFEEEYSRLNNIFGSENNLKVSGNPVDDFLLHQEVIEKCKPLFVSHNYAEAVEKSFKIVKDKLRSLTGYEKGSDAFGSGKLHIKGASATNVDEDFNKAVMYLTMAIDRFRNEKSHTADAKIDNPMRAYQYLTLSSLALFLLENSEIKNS